MDNSQAIIARMAKQQAAAEQQAPPEPPTLEEEVLGNADYYKQAYEDGIAGNLAAAAAGNGQRGYLDTATVSFLLRAHLTPQEKAEITPPAPGDFFNSPLKRHMELTTISPSGKQGIMKHSLIARGLGEQCGKRNSSAEWEELIFEDVLLSKSVITQGHTRNLSDSIVSPITQTRTEAQVTTRNSSPGFLSSIFGSRRREPQV